MVGNEIYLLPRWKENEHCEHQRNENSELVAETVSYILQWWFVNPGSDNSEILLIRTKSAGTDFRFWTDARFSNPEISAGNKRVRINESSLYIKLHWEFWACTSTWVRTIWKYCSIWLGVCNVFMVLTCL